VKEKGLRLKEAKLLIVVMLSALLLSSTAFVFQTSGADASSGNETKMVMDEADAFFDDSYIHDIYLYFEDSNWYDTLYEAHDNNPEDPYFPARFVSQGVEINRIGARFKGLSTFGFGGIWGGGGEDEDIKKPFRLDFNMYDEEGVEETTFFGLKKLNLNNAAFDPTMMREKLFMDFARQYVPTPRSVYTRLYVNGEYYGLYLAMEHIDNTFVESRFGNDEEGNIYKIDRMGPLTYAGPDPADYVNYEIKNNDENQDYSDLIELTDILTNTPTSQLPQKLEPILDVKEALYSLAILDLFVNLDSYIGNARNYFLYDRSDTGKINYMLWDANLAFGNFGLMSDPNEDQAEYDVIPPSTMSGFGFRPGGTATNLTLVKSLMAVESYKRTYLRMVAQMLREGFDAESMNARMQEIAGGIRYEVNNSPNMQTEPSEFEPALGETVDFVTRRAAFLNTHLDSYAKKTDLQLNDLMTVNQSTIADEHGDYDSWVEIYNLGPGLVNTAGLFLTDDMGVPNKWALPEQNLDDGEFLLLWLDAEPSEGEDHAPFSLNSNGGDLYFYMASDGGYVLVDNISYPILDADASYGRFPDGEGVWQIMSEAVTPAQANQFGLPPENLFINEFMANNDEAVPGPNSNYPDWIELYNGGTEAVDLTGMYLTDDFTDPKWQFPAGTTIAAGGYLVVWADNSSQSTEYARFNLNAQGETIYLLAQDAQTVVDFIAFAQQFDDVSYGRRPDGASSWNYLTPTPNESNTLGAPVTPGGPVHVPSDLCINEFMANNDVSVPGPNGDFPDWIELYNGGTEAVDLTGMYLTSDLENPNAWQFPDGTTIQAGGFLVVWADNSVNQGLMHSSFSLNATGEAIGLFAEDEETVIDSITFGAQNDDVAFGRFPDGSPDWNYLMPTPGAANEMYESALSGVVEDLFINEFMANNDISVPGPNNDYPDWIELYNGGNESIDLGGMYLSDDLSTPKWKFPYGTTIAPKDFLVVWADNGSDINSLHTRFGLNASGENIGLFARDGETLVDSIVFGKQTSDVAYGRLPDGGTSWNYMTPTAGLANELGEIVKVGATTQFGEVPEGLYINELMADNQITIPGPDGTYPDWIELYNAGNESIDLGGMFLTDDLTDPTAWSFPNDTIIEPEGYLLVWADNSSDKSSLHSGFGLNANGEEIGLFASDGVTLIDSVIYAKQLGDVSYGRLPDGSSHWEPLLKATPGWGNNKPKASSETPIWLILLLIGVIIALGALVVAAGKIHTKRRK